MKIKDKFLTAKEVAELLNLDEKTIYAKACKKEIPSVKIAGKNLRFRLSEIEKYAGVKFFINN